MTNYYTSYKNHTNNYSKWRQEKDLRNLKKEIYIKENPDKINLEDLQKAKTLLRAVDLMDELTHKKTENFEVVTDSVINMGLQYSAIGGTALGFLLTKTKYIKEFLEKIAKYNKRTSNIFKTSFAAIFGIACTIASFPIYVWSSKAEQKIYRKTRHEVMRKDLEDSRIFATLTNEQEKQLQKNIEEYQKPKKSINPVKSLKTLKNKIKAIKNLSTETKEENIQRRRFENKLFDDEKFYKQELSEKEIENAQKDQQLLIDIADKISRESEEYQEKMEIVTNGIVTGAFALGSLFSLMYERIAKKLNFKTKALPTNIGVFLMLASTLLATKMQTKASQVGRFKAKQELKEHPELLVYIKNEELDKIPNEKVIKPKKENIFKFIKNIWKNNYEYETWKRKTLSKEKNISKSFENIELDNEQIKDSKRLQRNTFKTFSNMDSNTHKYTEGITVIGQAIQYPITLAFSALATLLSVKHLHRLEKATSTKDIFNHSIKYIGTIISLTLPSIIINNKIIQEQKQATQVCDMLTLNDMQDYRFFADYNEFKENQLS